MGQDEIRELLADLKEKQDRLVEEVSRPRSREKDPWDKLAAIAPIVSGVLISTMAGYFTYSYNQQQLHLQEIQTIEKFIPHMLGDEKEKKAAILAMSTLANTELAAHFASLFASEGTVSALKSIATTGNTNERRIAQKALESALETVAEKYTVENREEDAERAYTEAIKLKEQTLGANHPDVSRTMDRLAENYRTAGKLDLAESLFRKSLAAKERVFGSDDPMLSGTLRGLADICRLQGKPAEAEQLLRRAASIDQRAVDHATTVEKAGEASAQTAPAEPQAAEPFDRESEGSPAQSLPSSVPDATAAEGAPAQNLPPTPYMPAR